jgi:mono/diheme cytochrome c family protein
MNIGRVMTIALAAVAGAVMVGAAVGQTAAPSPPASLPPGPGRDLMVRTCSVCHQPEIAAQQHLSRQDWSDLVEQMASRGASASDAEFAQITDYLARSFPAEQVKQPSSQPEVHKQ